MGLPNCFAIDKAFQGLETGGIYFQGGSQKDLLSKAMTRNLDILYISTGTGPINMLFDKINDLGLLRVPISFGISPAKSTSHAF